MLLFAIIMYLGCAVCGLLPGLVLSYGVYGLLSFIVNKLCGRKVSSFKYLFFRYDKYNGFSTGRFSPVCELTMRKENDTEAAAIGTYIAVTILLGLSTFAVFIIVILAHLFLNISVIMGGLLSGIALWFFFDIIFRVVLLVQTLKSYKAPSLTKEYTKIAKKFVEGVPIDEIDIPPYASYGYKNPSKEEIAHYQHYAYLKAVWNFDANALHEIVSSMEESIQITYGMREGAYLMTFQSNYYDLLHYYSALNFNKHRAEYIFYTIGKDLKRDKDANGKRVLAYYTFFVLEDPQTAMKLVKEGLELVPEFPIISKRPLEERLLCELEEIISVYFENTDSVQSYLSCCTNEYRLAAETACRYDDIDHMSEDELYDDVFKHEKPVNYVHALIDRLMPTDEKRAKDILLKLVRFPVNANTQEIIVIALEYLLDFTSDESEHIGEVENVFIDLMIGDDELYHYVSVSEALANYYAEDIMPKLVRTDDKRAKELLLKFVKLPADGDTEHLIGTALKYLIDFKSDEIEKIFVDFAIGDDKYLADIAKDYWEDE